MRFKGTHLLWEKVHCQPFHFHVSILMAPINCEKAVLQKAIPMEQGDDSQWLTDAPLVFCCPCLVTLSFPSLDRPVVPHRPRVFCLHLLGTGQNVREILLQVQGRSQAAGNGLMEQKGAREKTLGHGAERRCQRDGQIRDSVALSWTGKGVHTLPGFLGDKGGGRRSVCPGLQCSLTTKWK